MRVKLDNAKMTENLPVEGRASNWSWARTGGFAQALKDSEREDRRRICDELLGKIDKVSAELKDHPTPAGFKRYRGLITSFMKEALSQSYTVHDESYWDRDGNRKSLVAVQQINQALEEMMDQVMQKEKGQIDLAAQFDQIRGWLLDLYL